MHTGIQSSLYWGKVISLGVILGISIQFAAAWTNPTVSAPGGNAAGPVNTGTISQVKSAGLGLTGNLVVGGQIQQSLANCDLKSNASGVLYCGTDAVGVRVESYDYLPNGSLAGYCDRNWGRAIAPAVLLGGTCGCRAGWTTVMPFLYNPSDGGSGIDRWGVSMCVKSGL